MIKNILSGVKESSRATLSKAGAVKEQVSSTIDGAISRTKYHAESTTNSLSGAVIQVADTIGDTVDKTLEVTKEATGIVAYGATVIGMVVAPVPTAIGLSLMFLMDDKCNSGQRISERRKRRSSREVDNAIILLKKYGKIPSNAIVQTNLICLEIDAVSGEVTGKVLKGEFANKELVGIQDEDLLRLAEAAPDMDTAKIINGYLSYRARRLDKE